jgi:hypothetical protein
MDFNVNSWTLVAANVMAVKMDANKIWRSMSNHSMRAALRRIQRQ